MADNRQMENREHNENRKKTGNGASERGFGHDRKSGNGPAHRASAGGFAKKRNTTGRPFAEGSREDEAKGSGDGQNLIVHRGKLLDAKYAVSATENRAAVSAKGTGPLSIGRVRRGQWKVWPAGVRH